MSRCEGCYRRLMDAEEEGLLRTRGDEIIVHVYKCSRCGGWYLTEEPSCKARARS